VHPGFLDVVFLFREKLGPVEEGFSSAFVDIIPPAVHDIQAGTTQGCSYRNTPICAMILEAKAKRRHRL